ncbi:MAG: O-antigen ligase family protein [Anaerolineae bacterium]|jgi:putative inorganic carbon (HCO3(-)) transporter
MTAKTSSPPILLKWLADWQVIPVGLLVPILVFPTHNPSAVVALALLMIPVLWILHRLARGRFVTATPVDIPLFILLLTLPVGVWAAALPDLAIPHVIKYLLAVAFFYALVNTLTTSRKVKLAGWVVLIATALVAGVSMLGTAWSGGSKFLPASLTDRIPRLINAFWNPKGFHPNIVGGILTMLVPVTAAYAWGARTWPHRLLLGLLFAGETLALVLTQSRGALLGFAVALIVVAVGRERRWAWAVPVLIVATAVGVALYGVQPSLDLLMSSVGDSVVQSGEGRLELVSRGLYMIQDFSFTGIGLGMFSRVLPLLYPLFLVGPDTEVPHVHNIYLQMGIDHGLPGLIAFLAFLVLLWVMGVQAIRSSRGRPWEPLAIGLLAGLASHLVHGLVDTIGFTPRASIIVWGHFGLLTAVWCWTQTCASAKYDMGVGSAETKVDSQTNAEMGSACP